VELSTGDLLLFPAGDQHELAAASAAALRLKPVAITGESLRTLLRRGEIAEFRKEGAGEATRIVCGFLACDKRLAEPMLSSLPRLLKIRMRDGGTAAWVRSSIQFSVAESASSRPGSAAVLARLSELLFAEAIRHYADELPPGQSGFLAALRDRHGPGARLRTRRRRIPGPWRSSRRGRLSRSALGERFNELLGAPPMQYLARWRTSLAARLLRESDVPVLRVATDVGYESEAAFNRAFKRELGLPPAAWRKRAALNAMK
jgi:AraC-like DNA-binding protein